VLECFADPGGRWIALGVGAGCGPSARVLGERLHRSLSSVFISGGVSVWWSGGCTRAAGVKDRARTSLRLSRRQD
jgi:hypothetical protein